jgi:uncharacterized oligopeptide transporter (OPT) family protein
MRRELTWQAVVTAILVAAVVSAAYPYVVLKLGMGPNVSVVSAFLGAVLLMTLSPRTHGQNRLMNNIVQTAGTSAASTAFMCVIAAAVDFTVENPIVSSEQMNHITGIEPWSMFLWLCCAGGIGVLFTVLFRRHFLDDPKMVFADGVAAAETILVLDSRGREGRDKLQLLGVCTLVSALLELLREGLKIKELGEWLRDGVSALKDFYLTPTLASLRVGIEWSLLNVGTGLLISLNVCLSMLAATVLFAVTGPELIERGVGRDIVLNNVHATYRQQVEGLIDRDWKELTPAEQKLVRQHGGKQAAAYMQKDYYVPLLAWYMWPATGLMIAAAITAVLLKWRSIAQSFRDLQQQARQGTSEDVSLSTVLIGSLILTAGLAWVQHEYFEMDYVQTIIAVLCSLPLILVGIRVLGETNNGPISVMMNGLQAVFAAFWPASVGHNLVAAGVAGSCSAQGQGTIQDYKTGKIVGSTPRILTWVQLAAVPIGAAAVAIMYPLLKQNYRLGDTLPAPTGLKISNMALFLSQGIDALPEGALLWTIIATLAGVLIVLANHFWHLEWLPSAGGFGFGLILPGTLNISIAIGGIYGWLWMRLGRTSYDRYAVTVASGFIAGGALWSGLITPVISWFVNP